MKTLTVSLLSALCLAAPAWAGQGTPADSVRHLQGVEVTARLRQEQGINPLGVPAKKLPLTISSLADSTLSLRAITQVKDALRFVPAVQMKSSFGAFREISVRGFYNTVYMVDGVRDERSTLNSYPLGDLYNVDQIEVLKGPASVLYGYAATGGVVNVTRRVPTEKFTLGAHVRGGSLGYFDLGANVGGKITDGLHFYAGGFLSGGKQWRSTNDKNRSLFASLSYTKGIHNLILRLEGRNDFYGTDAGLAPVMEADMYRVSMISSTSRRVNCFQVSSANGATTMPRTSCTTAPTMVASSTRSLCPRAGSSPTMSRMLTMISITSARKS